MFVGASEQGRCMVAPSEKKAPPFKDIRKDERVEMANMRFCNLLGIDASM